MYAHDHCNMHLHMHAAPALCKKLSFGGKWISFADTVRKNTYVIYKALCCPWNAVINKAIQGASKQSKMY